MWLIEPVFMGPTKSLTNLVGFELAGRRWWVGLGTNIDGHPIMDGARFVMADSDNPQRDHREYTGVLLRLPPTRGRGLGIASRRPNPKWRLGRLAPWWLTAPRPALTWWPPKPKRIRGCAVDCMPMEEHAITP